MKTKTVQLASRMLKRKLPTAGQIRQIEATDEESKKGSEITGSNRVSHTHTYREKL